MTPIEEMQARMYAIYGCAEPSYQLKTILPRMVEVAMKATKSYDFGTGEPFYSEYIGVPIPKIAEELCKTIMDIAERLETEFREKIEHDMRETAENRLLEAQSLMRRLS